MNKFRSEEWLDKIVLQAWVDKYQGLLKLFDEFYICEDCAKLSATYLENCQNPLHQLHDAAWEIEK